MVIQSVIIPDEVKANPDDFAENSEEHHDELDVIKPEMIWRRTIRKKFKHKTDKARPPVIAPAPLPSIPGTLCAPALAAQIIVDKFADHLPHYRESQRFRRRYEADIGRQTLNTWTHATARHLRRKSVEAKGNTALFKPFKTVSSPCWPTQKSATGSPPI